MYYLIVQIFIYIDEMKDIIILKQFLNKKNILTLLRNNIPCIVAIKK